MRKLPAKYMSIVMPLFLSIMMSAIVSFIATLKAIGFDNGLFMQWLQAWGISWLVAFPVLLVVLPLVRKLAGMVVEKA